MNNNGGVSFDFVLGNFTKELKNSNESVQNLSKEITNINEVFKDTAKDMRDMNDAFNKTRESLSEIAKHLSTAANSISGAFNSMNNLEIKGVDVINAKIDTLLNNINKLNGVSSTSIPGDNRISTPTTTIDSNIKNFSKFEDVGVPLSTPIDMIPKPGVMDNITSVFKNTGDKVVDLSERYGDKVKKSLLNPFSFLNKEEKPEKSILGRLIGLGVATAVVKKGLNTINSFVKGSLSVASDLEETQNVVNTAFKGSEKAIESFSKNSIKNLGISELKAKQYASTYKAMMNGMKHASDETKTDISMMLTGLAADVGSFFSATLSTDEAFEMLKAPLDKQSLKLARVGVNMTQESVAAWAKDQGIIYKDLDQSLQTMTRIAFITDSLSMTTGDFIKNQNSWHNQLELITNKMQQIKGELGQIFMVVLKPILEIVNHFLDIFMSKIDILADKLYNLFGIERPEVEIKENVPLPVNDVMGELDVDSNIDEEDEKNKEDKKDNKENQLQMLSIDNMETLQTDFSDPEKEKDRDNVKDQSQQVQDLMKKMMDQRNEKMEEVLKAVDEDKSSIALAMISAFKKINGEIKNFLQPYLEPLKEFGGTFVDTLIKGIKELAGGFMDQFDALDTESVIIDIIEEATDILETIGGSMFDMLGEDGEDLTFFEVIGKMLAYILHIYLQAILIVLKIFNSVLLILYELGILNAAMVLIQVYFEIVVEFYDTILEMLDAVIGYIKDPEKATEKATEKIQEYRESGQTGKAFGTHMFHSLKDLALTPIRFAKGVRGEDTTGIGNLLDPNLVINPFNNNDKPKPIGGSNTPSLTIPTPEVVNHISIDGEEISHYTQKIERRKDRITN